MALNTSTFTHADVLKQAHDLPQGCVDWLLADQPNPLWNSGARASAYWALVRRKLKDSNGNWTKLGRAVQAYVRRQRGYQ